MSAPNKVAQRMWKAPRVLDALSPQFYRNRQSYRARLSVQWLPDIITSLIAALNPDVVNLHWIGDGFVAAEALSEYQLFGHCTICQHLRAGAVTAKSAIATPNPAAIVLYSAIIKAGIYPAGFGNKKRKHGKI